MPTITAARILTDVSALITLMNAAAGMVHYQAHIEEMQLAACVFTQQTQRQLTNALRADKAAMLNARADQLADALKAYASRREWAGAKTLMRFGGRPPRCGTERPYSEGETGTPSQAASSKPRPN